MATGSVGWGGFIEHASLLLGLGFVAHLAVEAVGSRQTGLAGKRRFAYFARKTRLVPVLAVV